MIDFEYYDVGGKYHSRDGAEAFNIQPNKINDINYTRHQASKMGKYIVGFSGSDLDNFVSNYMEAWETARVGSEPGESF